MSIKDKMAPQFKPTADWKVSAGQAEDSDDKVTSSDLVMAWARDKSTNEPRYILELDENHRGLKCNCVCVSCEREIIAINAAKTEYKQRPHFRHPKGSERDSCLILAARFAISQQLLEDDMIELPRRRQSSRVAGLSGEFYEAWVELPPERIRITDTHFQDKASAVLTLDDGRQLLVELTGSLAAQEGEKVALIPTISLNVTDPEIAGMSPDELRKRLKLLWAGGCWHSHWKDRELIGQADSDARQKAVEALDWLDDEGGNDEVVKGLTQDQRRETLLHREVKAILGREKRINLPELSVRVERNTPRREPLIKVKVWPPELVTLDDVRLERRLGRVIPDVMAMVTAEGSEGDDYQLLIEVTVTNPINDERLQRIQHVNLPTLEIDIGRMGGTVTRQELVKLVVEELAAKRWVHHPKAVAEELRLNAEIEAEVMAQLEREQLRAQAMQVSALEWSRKYLEAIRTHGDLQALESPGYDPVAVQKALEEVQECATALALHGYPEAEDNDKELFEYRGGIIHRLLSIKEDKGVGYRLDSGWQVINAIHQEAEKYWHWHTLYLMAIKQYKPKLNDKQAEKIDEWRERVLSSIKDGNSTYVRNPKYDRLLGLLFPEMKEALDKDFGRKPTSQPKLSQLTGQQLNAPQREYLDTGKNDLWLKGSDLEEWKRKNPDAAKVWFKS